MTESPATAVVGAARPSRRWTDRPGVQRLLEAATLMGVWYAVALHLLWAASVLIDRHAENATAVHGPAQLFPNQYGLALIFISVAACALGGVFLRMSLGKVLLLVPQQIILGVSAAAAVRAIVLGHFADGIARPHLFIFADQIPAILALVVHSLTIVYLSARLTGWPSRSA